MLMLDYFIKYKNICIFFTLLSISTHVLKKKSNFERKKSF